MYYATMEQFGRHKREILASRVRAGQEDQRQAEKQFLSAYEAFKRVASYDGGELESVYNQLNGEFTRSEGRAEQVRDRIRSIENVASALFAEWEQEIGEISRSDLRRRSELRLRETQQRYGGLIRAMKRAEARMEPVLTAFRDQVLFLKHNLNAQAIASLEGTAGAIQGDVDQLIHEMRASIREAEVFLTTIAS
jgi:hypothetical protein